MGRWKDNGSGQMYWDANDSGPDQGAPPPLSQGGGGDPAQSGARPGYHYEWSGGFTGGKHEVPDNPSDPRTPPLTGKDLLQGPGMDGGQGPYDKFPGQGPRPEGPWNPKIYNSGKSPWGLGGLNGIAGQPQDLYADIGGAPRDPEGRTIQDIFANRAGTPPAGWQYQPGDPSQATDRGPYAWGQLGGLFGGLGSLTKAAGNAIGPYGTPR